MNSVCILGRLTKEIEIKRTTNGKVLTSFSVAVDSGKQGEAYFIDCVAWETTATNLQKYFHKGDKIGISGILTTRNYDDAEGKKRKVTEVLVNRFDFCNSKNTEAPGSSAATTAPAESVVEEPNGELPFEL